MGAGVALQRLKWTAQPSGDLTLPMTCPAYPRGRSGVKDHSERRGMAREGGKGTSSAAEASARGHAQERPGRGLGSHLEIGFNPEARMVHPRNGWSNYC